MFWGLWRVVLNVSDIRGELPHGTPSLIELVSPRPLVSPRGERWPGRRAVAYLLMGIVPGCPSPKRGILLSLASRVYGETEACDVGVTPSPLPLAHLNREKGVDSTAMGL